MKRITININGIVQGVGFRPFIHKLVEEYKFCGWVRNTSFGVVCEVEGEEDKLFKFIDDIKIKAPRLAQIESINYSLNDSLMKYKNFEIIKSEDNLNSKFTLISPDICICDDCKRELFNKNDRRYHYPFINCTNCGPRFTIIKDVPYDRDKTTMKDFKMCSLCSSEYKDINDRRYHAQPDCCSKCGPKVFFKDSFGNNLDGDAIDTCREFIKAGKIVAIKGLGGYHIACDAKNINAVKKLREKKHRYDKPFAVMCKDIDETLRWCYVTDSERRILEDYKRPIVLLKKKNESLNYISMDNKLIGVMLPYTPVHYLLFEKDLDIIVMTSANISEMPVIYDNDEAFDKLKDIVDGFLMNNRDIQTRCDDSLLSVFENKEYLIRRSRGFVPSPIKVQADAGEMLACGAEQKASFAVSKGMYVFMSQHIGDLKNMETYKHYETQIKHFEKIFNIKPKAIVCDIHPDYLSTEYAKEKSAELNIPLIYIQHHYAHMVSCMADNNLNDKAIGVIWDGTGLGLDNSVWGGEFLVGDYKSFMRMGSIRPINLVGGDKAIRDIYRIGYALIYDSNLSIPKENIKTKDFEDIINMINHNINCIKASSIGRLFDGVSSILNIKNIVSYEGQGAISLENAGIDTDECYDIDFYDDNGITIFDWRPMIKNILYEIKQNKDKGLCASKFMNTLCIMGNIMCKKIRNDTGINNVVLSGGVFQNMYILSHLKDKLKSDGFNVYNHIRVSTNDESIAFGQLIAAANGGGIKCV